MQAPAVAAPSAQPPHAAARPHNVKLEAFKQAVFNSKAHRTDRFREREAMSKTLSAQLGESCLSEDQKEAVRISFSRQQDEYMRESRKQVTIMDFDLIKVIGTGAFGIVRLCRKKDTGEVFAMKQMRKKEMVHKNQVHHVRAEKDVLSIAKNDWVIGLHFTFQDDHFLYMVMDYLPGGDLMTHLMRKDTFSEAETRFYIAELVEAVDYIHTNLHYVHRDIKPDNIVFDKEGHIHLLDFGLCKHNPPQSAPEEAGGHERVASSAARGHDCRTPRHPTRAKLQSVVGTPDYMGPEVYRKNFYGKECDWWSVGIIMFEMLFGGPPFSDDGHDPMVTSARVMRWRQHFHMPAEPSVGAEAQDLLRGLICDVQERLTAEGIRAHPFFMGLDFKRLREMEPPIRPVVKSPLDTSNFDDFSGAEAQYGISPGQHQVVNDPSHFAFHDYGYRRDLEAKKPSVTAALSSAAVIAQGSARGEKSCGGAAASGASAGVVCEPVCGVNGGAGAGFACSSATGPTTGLPIRYLSSNGDVFLADRALSPTSASQLPPASPVRRQAQVAQTQVAAQAASGAPSGALSVPGLQQVFVAATDQRHQQPPPLTPTGGAWGPRVGTAVYQANNYTALPPQGFTPPSGVVRQQAGYPLNGSISLPIKRNTQHSIEVNSHCK